MEDRKDILEEIVVDSSNSRTLSPIVSVDSDGGPSSSGLQRTKASVAIEVADVEPRSDSAHSYSNSSTVGVDISGHEEGSGAQSEDGKFSGHSEPDTESDSGGLGTKIYNVTCGLLRAKLHYDKFMCPGIHQPCVEYEGEFYSPKQFTVVAAKDKQKDWKGSIKIDRMPLRTLMERKRLDFFMHETFCSGKCASKNYRPSLKDSDLSDIIGSNATVSAADSGLSNSFPSATVDISQGSETQRSLENYIKSSFGLEPTQPIMARSKPFQFWQAVHHLGLLPDILNEFTKQIEEFKLVFLNRPDLRPKVSEKLSEVVKVMDMSESIKRILQTKRLMTKAETDILGTEIEELKKRADEQRKRQMEAKRKADIFDQLFALSAKSPKMN